MRFRMCLVFVASALLWTRCILAQNPAQVQGPSLLEPLNTPRKWMGAASATQYDSGYGKRDYFGFAGGDTGLSGACPDVLSKSIDLYYSTMGGAPKKQFCQGVGCLTLSKSRSFASGVGVTFPPNTGPKRSGYLIFAGGIECSGQSTRTASDVVDIVRLSDPQVMLTPLALSSPRNYVASSSICKWNGRDRAYKCLAFFAGGQMQRNTYTNVIDILDLGPDTPQFLQQGQQMTVARAFLASVSFQDSMLFGGGKSEVGIQSPVVTAYGQVDYFLFTGSGSNGSIVDTQQNLSTPRFDLSGAGLSVLQQDATYHYAVFVGGTTQDNKVSEQIDVWTVVGDQDPAVANTPLVQARTSPTVAVIARATQKPIIVVMGGDSEIVAGCQPATIAEFIIVDPTAADPTIKVSSTTQMLVGGVSVAACDTATASSEIWILQAGGAQSSGNSTANVVAFCWGCAAPPGPTPPPGPLPTPPPAPPGNLSPDNAASSDLPPGSKAALAIFFITYFANLAGVVFYCREKAVLMPIPLASAAIGWILCWIVILFVLPSRDMKKLQDRSNLQSRML